MKNFNNIISIISNIRDSANKMIISELAKNNIKDLAPSHGDILQLLFYTKEEVTMKDIAKKINRDKSTVTSLVNKLQKLGYIVKLKSNQDDRKTIILITEKGMGLKPIFQSVSEKLISTVYKGFTENEKKEVYNAIKKIQTNIN